MTDFSAHPWLSGLLGDPEVAAIFSAEAELARFFKVEAAWTRALGAVGNAPEAEAVANIIEGAQIDPHSLKDGVSKDGIPIPALVGQLKALAGPDAAQFVHKGLTSQDVMDTSLMLALGEVISRMKARLDALDAQLGDLQTLLGSATLFAYTRMQPAMETNAADVIGRWRQPLRKLLKDVSTAEHDCKIIQWGGPIGARDHPQATDLGAVFAQNLGLVDPGRAWHTDRTVILQVAQTLARITVTTGKIGEDIALMAAIGSEQIVLSSGGASSAMPHKNNPVKAEALISLSNLTASLQASLIMAARHEGFRSGKAWTLEQLVLQQICETAGASLIQAKELLNSVKAIGCA